MWLFGHSPSPYIPVAPSECEQETVDKEIQQQSQKDNVRRRVLLYLISFIFAIFLLACYVIPWNTFAHQEEAHHCIKPIIRREWQSLSRSEKTEYLRAVQCLSTQPSQLTDNGTLYSDFALVHRTSGSYTHGAASFLPWHRYFIQVYENTLKEQCEYDGTLPYWNWSLDWEDITHSPIWDTEIGFGGDGNATGAITVGKGRCVIDGPFAGFHAEFFNNVWHPHCLSRGFLKEPLMTKYSGSKVRPEEIEKLLQEPDYASFLNNLWRGVHFAVPEGIRGDFGQHTGPYDPIFFLHHGQLDRIWWLWQQENPEERLTEFVGRAHSYSNATASLNDLLDLNGFVPNVLVSTVMDTVGGTLCYQY